MKTSELIGPALDWAVAKCEGYFSHEGRNEYWASKHGTEHFIKMHKAEGHGVHWTHSSTDWAEGGPIIEREGIGLHRPMREHWQRDYEWIANKQGIPHEQRGHTPLIAAMRCFVASKLGDEVDVPEELT